MSARSTADTLRRHAKTLASIPALTAAISAYLAVQGLINSQPRTVALAACAVLAGAASVMCFIVLTQARMEDVAQPAHHDEEPQT